MKVLVVGGGGREHALAWKLKQDDPSLTLLAAPGNPGIAELGRCYPIEATDVDGLLALARRESVALTVVGPESALAAGIVDRFRDEGLPIFGPTRAAAQIETSKAFAKQLMHDAGVPTALALTCTEAARAKGAVRELGTPIVIKASGLAAGKGVIVCQTLSEADDAIDAMLVRGAYGVAGTEVLVEEFMEGEELSMFAITDGERLVPLVAAQDHKRLLEGDHGPNTGGMGAYAPVSIGDAGEVLEHIMRPAIRALAARGTPFTGLLYAGLMLTREGPKVVEFNCRFGDPETEAILPILDLDPPLLELMLAVARGEPLPPPHKVTVRASGHAVTTVLASAGYPDRPHAGDRIELPPSPPDVLVFHAGTKRTADGALVTHGGRVLAVTGVAPSMEEAQKLSAAYAASIEFEGKQFRPDIGWRELARSAGAGNAGAA